MITLAILLFLQGVLAYYCTEVARNFQGASINALQYISFCGMVGGWAHYALVIWSFFVMTWYIPIIVIVASITMSHFVFILDSVVMRVIAPALCIILTIALAVLFVIS